jgi:aryl-alcohol dehydrogenase-like predicted oxidoreductase
MTLRHTALGRSGIRVSELCLGTMTFGTGWGWGADEPACQEIYAAFREAGGNFVDTADIYTAGGSEEIVGRLVAAERDAIVLGTKFTLPTGDDPNAGGSHRKSLRASVETSLRRLGTDYLDVLWVHAWDQRTPIEETLRALDDLVHVGKILAIGLSNMPAWVISRADVIADLRGWSSISAIQLEYSLAARTPDRELLPMARSLGLPVCAWSPLARGLLAGKAPEQPATRVRTVVAAATAVADEIGATTAQVALAWVLHHGLIPLLGASTLSQIKDNLDAAHLHLGQEQLARLDAVSEVRLGYPHEFLRDRCTTLSEE